MGRINVTFPIFADSNVQPPDVAAAGQKETIPVQPTLLMTVAGGDAGLEQPTRQRCVSAWAPPAAATSSSPLAYLQLHHPVNLPG